MFEKRNIKRDKLQLRRTGKRFRRFVRYMWGVRSKRPTIPPHVFIKDGEDHEVDSEAENEEAGKNEGVPGGHLEILGFPEEGRLLTGLSVCRKDDDPKQGAETGALHPPIAARDTPLGGGSTMKLDRHGPPPQACF
ncbi:hypothetical protein PFLUV_G00038000 [Perca fluviatilis]|uniref:Uncharacterized protein n=1 Tax=Perca fluviatilis TaxID=8168 RepID=A0A6A5FNU1_PERFL|nr:hypothetical protein PFLUV_G00038000 [Perca fluviatilis]